MYRNMILEEATERVLRGSSGVGGSDGADGSENPSESEIIDYVNTRRMTPGDPKSILMYLKYLEGGYHLGEDRANAKISWPEVVSYWYRKRSDGTDGAGGAGGAPLTAEELAAHINRQSMDHRIRSVKAINHFLHDHHP